MKLKKSRIEGRLPYIVRINGETVCLFELKRYIRLSKLIRIGYEICGMRVVWFIRDKAQFEDITVYDVVLGCKLMLLYFDGGRFFECKYRELKEPCGPRLFRDTVRMVLSRKKIEIAQSWPGHPLPF